MSSPLATRYQYLSVVPANAGVSNAMIDAGLTFASDAVRDYLFRKLDSATYKDWFTLDGVNPTEIFLPETPVTRVQMVSGMITVGTIQYTGQSGYAMLSSDLDGMYLSYMSNTGTVTTTTLLYSVYPTIGQLVAAILATQGLPGFQGYQGTAGWTVSYSASAWANNPSRFIKPIASQMATQGVIFNSAHYIACQSVLIDEGTLELSGTLGRWAYVEYIAGYTMPSDDVGHTAVTLGTLPSAITLATINATRDYLTLQGVNGGLLKSESLGDYNYSLANVNPMELNKIVANQAPLLNRYRRFGWIG